MDFSTFQKYITLKSAKYSFKENTFFTGNRELKWSHVHIPILVSLSAWDKNYFSECNIVTFFFFLLTFLKHWVYSVKSETMHLFPRKMKADKKVEWLIFKILHLKNNEGSLYQLYDERLLNYLLDRIWWYLPNFKNRIQGTPSG